MRQPAAAGRACMQGCPGIAAAVVAVLMVTATRPASAQAPPEEGEVRLVAREDINGFATGAVQVFVGSQWGSVCTERFDDRDADVACRQLGLVAGVKADGDRFAPRLLADSGADMAEIVEAPFVLENLGCSGDEARLLDCPPQATEERPSFSGCTPFAENYAFVACGATTGPEEGSVRLADGAEAAGGGAQFGRLEIFFKGGWGTVCGIGESSRDPVPPVSQAAAEVACRQLGFSNAFLQPIGLPDSNGTLDRVPIWLPGADCDGTEDSLTSCPGVTLGDVSDRCRHDDDLSLLCFGSADPDMDGSLRLQDGESGTAFEYGRLEVFLRGFWSNICSTVAFTPDSAQVACKALGFGGGASLEFRQAFQGAQNKVLPGEDLPVALAEVDCDGSEASLLDCSSSDAAIRLCGTDNTVLACINPVAECDSEPLEEQGALRLIDGVGSPCDPMYTGIVEIFNEGRWGAVCAPFTEGAITADVVCRQLGFPQGAPVNSAEAVEDPRESEESEVVSDIVWLFDVLCRGDEATLTECLDDPVPGYADDFSDGTRSCDRRLHVACRQFAVDDALEQPDPAAAEGDVRLVEERSIANWAIGHLEVSIGGSWRQVCAAGFDDNDANVACRQLGYGAGTIGPFFDVPNPSANVLSFPDIGVTLLGCNGTEATLLECGRGDLEPPFFTNNQRIFGCRDNREPGLTLACVVSEEDGEEGDIRLVGGEVNEDVAFGVPQIFHAGAWGTFCDGDDYRYDYFEGSQYRGISTFDDESAALACTRLGFSSGFWNFGGSEAQASEQPPPWINVLFCGEYDTDFTQCNRNRPLFGNTASCGVTMELFCSNAPARALDGEARLVGGRADPSGAWEYGRLELRDRGVFVGLRDLVFGEALGRRGAQVACRQLGYPAGAEVIIGDSSALPGPAGVTDTVSAVKCAGDEEKLSDCEVFRQAEAFDFCSAEDACNVALLCSNPANCTAPRGAPATGDVRLVPLPDTPRTTAECDPVHFGGVEIFNGGRWGAVCVGGAIDQYTLDAEVVCRQLGFPFGRLYDIAEAIGSYYDYNPFPPEDVNPSDFTWASEVVCTGPEERLEDCLFTESPDNTLAGLPETGADCFRILGVACSQFDLVDASAFPTMPTPAPAPMPAPMPAPPPAPVPNPSPTPVTPTTRPSPPGKQPGGRPLRPRRQRRSPPALERRPARSGPPPGASPPRTKRPRRMTDRGWTPGRVHKES